MTWQTCKTAVVSWTILDENTNHRFFWKQKHAKIGYISSGVCVLWTSITHIGSMGKWYIHRHEMVDFYGFHVGKYTSPMDPMGNSMHGIFTYNVVGQYSIHGGLEGTKTKNISVNNSPWHIMKSRSYLLEVHETNTSEFPLGPRRSAHGDKVADFNGIKPSKKKCLFSWNLRILLSLLVDSSLPTKKQPSQAKLLWSK